MEKSDEEENIRPHKTTSNYRKLLDSDSSEEEEREVVTKNEISNINNHSDESEEEISKNKLSKSRIINKNDDSSDTEDSGKESPVKKNRRKGVPQKRDISKPKEKVKRKSAIKAIDTIKEEIKLKELSEKQKFDREREVKIHYHKPKQYSLKEFMARKSINKPTNEKLQEQKTSNSILSMKMTSEQLETFAKKIKEREEEALEFFKSESESEEEEPNKNDENIQSSEQKEKPTETDIEKPCEESKVAIEEVPIDEVKKPIEEMTELINEVNKPCNEVKAHEGTKIEKLQETIEEKMDINSDEKENEIISTSDAHQEEEIMHKPTTVAVKVENPKFILPALKTLNEMSDSGNNMIIDLESGVIKEKKLTGAEMLFQKFLKTQAKPKKINDTICMNILSIENGKLENQRVKIKLDKEVELDHSRPGYSHELLKENLRNQIVQKRLVELKIKSVKAEHMEFEPEDKCKLNYDENDDELEGDQEADIDEESEDEDYVDEEEYGKSDKKKKTTASAFFDNEAINEDSEGEQNPDNEQDDESSESSDDTDDDDDEKTKTDGGVQKKSRILKAFVDSDEEEYADVSQKLLATSTAEYPNKFIVPEINNIKESEDLFNSQASDFTFNEPSVSEEIHGNNIESLFDTAPSQVNDEDLLELCSGQFASTQAFDSPSILSNNDFKFSSDILSSNVNNDDESDFVSQVPEREEPTANVVEKDQPQIEMKAVTETEPEREDECKYKKKLLESSDEEENTAEKEVKKIKKKIKKRKTKKLSFSDDEEEDEEQQKQQQIEMSESGDDADKEKLNSDGENEEVDAEDKEVFVDYDSEENEIEVKITKKEKSKMTREYFDGEAELSESEWGSADEDERGLDKYDIELGDEEQFDQTQLREEVGRIHARKEMDEDIKNVKKIQDLLFENEEDDGVGRERKFRWKNQSEGFTMEDENARDADNAEIVDEEECESNWRKMRHERETLINEQSQKMIESDTMSNDILLLDQNSQTVTSTSTSNLVKRKFQIIRTTSTSIGMSHNSESGKKDSPFLIKSGSKKFTNSFLSRDEQTLHKIASFISTKDDEVTNVSNSHGGNSMSFAPIAKVDDNKKRKSDGDEQVKVFSKKRKVETNSRFLLDQLK